MNRSFARIATAAAAGAMLVASSAANAAPVTYVVEIDHGNVLMPDTASSGTGSGLFVLDTEDKNSFTWLIQYSGLTGPATLAHIHQQPDGTEPGTANGGVAVNLEGALDGLDEGLGLDELDGNDGNGSLLGSVELDEDQVAALNSNLWYVNIHTEANPDGEIRGQILVGDVAAIPLPAAVWLMISGLGLVGVGFRRKRK